MTKDPYAPPKSEVKDIGSDRAIGERPKQVAHAVALLWLSIPLGIPATVYEYRQSTLDGPNPLIVTLFLFLYALTVVITIFINRGANWARLLFAFFAVLAFVSLPGLVTEFAKYPPIPLVVNILILTIDVIVLYLLFTRPGALWFRRG